MSYECSGCRILARSGNSVRLELTIVGEGTKAVAHGRCDLEQEPDQWDDDGKNLGGYWSIKKGTLEIGEILFTADTKKIKHDMEGEIDSMLCEPRFQLPGEFVGVGVKAVPDVPVEVEK